jgi:hypothetical protein
LPVNLDGRIGMGSACEQFTTGIQNRRSSHRRYVAQAARVFAKQLADEHIWFGV